jgi:hypothetical protein
VETETKNKNRKAKNVVAIFLVTISCKSLSEKDGMLVVASPATLRPYVLTTSFESVGHTESN